MRMMTVLRIDLDDYRNGVSNVFVGMDKGFRVANHTNINKQFNKYDLIEIVVPDYALAVNPSFLEGFLGKVISVMGGKKFMNKFNFLGECDISKDVNEVIERVELERQFIKPNFITKLKNLFK